jgi:hypothetical protein
MATTETRWNMDRLCENFRMITCLTHIVGNISTNEVEYDYSVMQCTDFTKDLYTFEMEYDFSVQE